MEIDLTGTRGEGLKAICDEKDYSHLATVKWHLSSGGYAKSNLGLMHQVVVIRNGIEIPKGLVVDHLNGNRLDNRISNLKVKTFKANSKNKSFDPCHDGYFGVKLNSQSNTFETIHKNTTFYQHSDARMCALCYDSIVTFCYGPGKRVNDTKLEPMKISFWKLNDTLMQLLLKWKSKHTDFIGVRKVKDGWKATIVVDLGTFTTPEEAAKEHDRAITIVKKEYKQWELNFG